MGHKVVYLREGGDWTDKMSSLLRTNFVKIAKYKTWLSFHNKCSYLKYPDYWINLVRSKAKNLAYVVTRLYLPHVYTSHSFTCHNRP